MNIDLIWEWNDRGFAMLDAAGRRCVAAEWPDGLRPGSDPQRAGEFVRQQQTRAGLQGDRIAAVLPADAVVFKHLELPVVDRSQLASVVRLQAEGRLSASLDQMQIDFAPLPSADPNRGDVLLAAVRNETVEAQRRLADAIGGRLVSLGVSALAAAELAARSRSPLPTQFIVVARMLGRAEVSLVVDRAVRHVQTIPTTDESETASRVQAAVRRCLLQPGAAASCPCFVIGEKSDFGELPPDAVVIDPWPVGSKPAMRQAGCLPHVLLGMLRQQQQPVLPTIDFVNSRGREAPRRRLRLWSAAATVAAVGLGWTAWDATTRQIRRLDERAASLSRLESKLQQRTEANDETLSAANTVEQWLGRSTPWLAELRTLSERLPPSDRLYLTDLQFTASGREGTLPAIKGVGLARERRDVIQLHEGLLQASDHYELQPHGMRASPQDAMYPERFEIEAHLRR